MECDQDGVEHVPAAGRTSFNRKRGVGANIVQLAFTVPLPLLSITNNTSPSSHIPTHYTSFMSNMDEISYWIYTKRAPCLFNYDNTIKKQVEQAQCSTTKPPSIKIKEEEHAPKKKRKLKLLNNASVSTEKPQNIYFKTPQKRKPTSSRSESDVNSDIDFNIKMPAAKKSRNVKAQKKCPTRVPKKNKTDTSTPKITILRRSLRKTPQIYNNSHHNTSFDIFKAGIVNGKPQETLETKADGSNKGLANDKMLPEKRTSEVVRNGQLEDSSDVSGFTANYIRSTKLHSSKRPQKLRNSRLLSKPSKKDDKTMICVNKSKNTRLPDTAVQNCSTGSSENASKLNTLKNNDHSTNMNKNTSLLNKFMESKLNDSNSKVNKQESKNKLNISFQSRSSGASRYPRRHKNNTETLETNHSNNIGPAIGNNATGGRSNMRKGAATVNRKENLKVSRTRSGKRDVKGDVKETSSNIQLKSSTEPMSSTLVVNLADPNASSRCLRSRTARDKVGYFYKESSSEGSVKNLSDSVWEQYTPKCVRKIKKVQDRTGKSLNRDLRNKSGFAACFSDSDSDSAPLKQRKFF